jgi:hypothetical protein
LKIKVDIQVTMLNADIMVGNIRVAAPERSLTRIFPFIVRDNLKTGWQTVIIHNELTFFSFQASEDEEAMYRQTDDLPKGKSALLTLMNAVRASATIKMQSELAQRAAAAGVRAFCEADLEADYSEPDLRGLEEYEAICAELFALPESTSPWHPIPQPRIRH